MYKSLEHTIRNVVTENAEVEHRVGVTVSDPNHNMVSKRNETYLKHVRLKARNHAHAQEKAKAYFRKKGYKVHETNVVSEDINNTDKFVGDKKPETTAPTPVIRPPNGPAGSQSGKEASLDRAHKAQNTSATMGNRVTSKPNPNTNVSEDLKDDAVEFAKDASPFYGTYRSYQRAKDAYNKGDYLGTAVHGGLTALGAAGDVGIASGIGTLAGAGIKGLAAKGAGAIAKKVAATGAEKAAAGAGEKAAAKVATGTVGKAAAAGAAEKAVASAEKGAAEKAVASAEKGAAEKAISGAEEGAAKKAVSSAEKKGAEGLGTKIADRFATGMGAGRQNNIKLHHDAVHQKNILRGVSTSASRARRHTTEETEARDEIENMPRNKTYKSRKDVEYIGCPVSADPKNKKSVLPRTANLKALEENARNKSEIIKRTKKEKAQSSDSTTLGDGKTRTFGDVVINPKLNPQDYTGNVSSS